MDRQIVIATFIALTLATVVKVVTPIESAATTHVVKIQQASQNLPLTFTPDPMWPVGP
jgi:hypothetical protein